MKTLIERSYIYVLGEIWQPNAGPCAMLLTLHPSDLRYYGLAGNVSRESIQDYLDTHAGDFQSFIDFSASIEDGGETIEIPWNDDENEMLYNDATYGEES